MIRRDQISESLMHVSQYAFALAQELNHGFVGSEHFLYGISALTDTAASKVLQNAGLDKDLIRDLIEEYDEDAKASRGMVLSMSEEAEQIGEEAAAKTEDLGHKKIEPEHVLLAMLDSSGSVVKKLIKSTGAVPERIAEELMKAMGKTWPKELEKTKAKKKKSTKSLEKYGRDLTAMAEEGRFDPFIGREKEIQRVIQILSRRTKNNPVLIGEPGVGKTAIAEGLAQQIAGGLVPRNLADKRIVSLEMSKLVAGAKFRGDFEERMENCIEEAKQVDDVILFIDELHTLIGAGSAEGSMDAANILKPALGRGEIQIIGSTTLDEYRKHIEKDGALERRFQSVQINEPEPEDALRILEGLRQEYEEFHEVVIRDEALKAAVELSARYIQDRYLPDKAIDVMDESVARVKTKLLTVPAHLKELEEHIRTVRKEKMEAVSTQEFEQAARLRDQEKSLRYQLEEKQKEWYGSHGTCIGAEDIAVTISEWTGIPVSALTEEESERLLHLEEILHKRVVGQDEAVTAVAKAIRRSRTAIREPNHPIGSFLFLGPTGVGKTELARTLAEVMFHDREAIIRLDMSEYMEKHTVSKFIGSPPGYVGYEEGGQLTEKVRRKPYSILLFDEIEKAHPDVWNLLLQIMDEGRLTDAQGRTVSFKNTIIILTSNAGARELAGKSAIGFGRIDNRQETRPIAEIKGQMMEELKKTFAPEFLNRLDDTIVFHQLEKPHILEIAGKIVAELAERAAKLGITIEAEDSAVALLAEQGFDPVYGARPLRRAIQSALEDGIAEKMLRRNIREGSVVRVTAQDGEIVISAEEEVEKKSYAQVK